MKLQSHRAKVILHVVVLAIGFGFLTSSSQADFVIDNFNNTNQSVSVSGAPASAANTIAVAGVIGGTRTLYVDNGVTGGAASLTVNPAFPVINNGRLVFSQDTAVAGNARVTWDGDLTNGLSGNGFAPTDITQGGVNAFLQVSLGADIAGTNVTMTFWTDDGTTIVANNPTRTVTFTIPTPQNPLTTVNIPFSSFTGSGDITKVVAAELFIDGSTSADVSIDFLQAVPVPEPTSLVLGSIGMAGLFGFRFRRSLKKAV